MESEIEKLVIDISNRLERYSRFTDTSDITILFERYLKTQNIQTRAFLLKSVMTKLEKIRRRFPLADITNEMEPLIDNSGDIGIGTVSFGGETQEFNLSKSDLNKNILICASVGHGKTSLIYNILIKLKDKKLNYMLFDLKRDYRNLALEENTIYLNTKNLRINPLMPPPGVSFKEWAVHITDAFSHSFSLLIGSRDFFLENLLYFYEHVKGREIPSIPGFISYLNSMNFRNEYSKVVKGRLNALVSSAPIFNCRNGVDIGSLDTFNVIFGIDDLGIHEQGFFLSFVMSYLFYMNLNNADKRNNLYKIVVIDDAHTVLDANKERDYAMGIPLLHQIIAKMRELGIGFIFSDQQLSALLSSVIQNSNTKFIGKINLIEDLYKIFGTGVKNSTIEAINSLSTGEFLVLPPKAIPYCLMKSTSISINKDLDDNLIYIAQKGYENKLAPPEDESEFMAVSFLEEVSKNHAINISLHVKNLSEKMSFDKFEEIRQKLSKEGLIAEVSVNLSEDKTSKFLYIPNNAAFRIKSKYILPRDFEVMSWDREQFIRALLREFIVQKLKKNKVAFKEDEVGIFLSGLNKIYITFMDHGNGLAKLLETPFNRVFDIVDDELTEKEVLAKLIETASPTAFSNLSALKVCKVNEFELNS